LELLEYARRHGLTCLVEQTCAPAEVYDRLLSAERDAYPGWERTGSSGTAGEAFAAREKAEWEAADMILCGSDFVRRGIKEVGGPAERCMVVPYGVETNSLPPAPAKPDGPLRVLICGQVSLMKGAPYAVAAARALRGMAEFRWIGGVSLLPTAAASIREHINLRGIIPRTFMPGEYRWPDVFLLPTISEGSAAVCYEAMATGLPVIATTNAGSVVRDGMDGFIVPIRDPEAIAGKLELLARDRELRQWMSNNARERGREFTLKKYGERLVATLRTTMERTVRAT
jgi:glycosyltransferase involved in cell wall biosynthesis